MLISTKGRYALRVMVDLAEHQTEGFIPLKEIAQRQEISEKYLESIIKLLVRAKLLNGHPAADGEFAGHGFLSGAGGRRLPAGSGVPHLGPVAGAGQGDQRLSGSYHHRRPDAAGRRLEQLCHLRTAWIPLPRRRGA